MTDKHFFKSFCSFTFEYSILICLDSIFLADGFKKVEKQKLFIVKKFRKILQLHTGVGLQLEEKKWLITNKGVSLFIN